MPEEEAFCVFVKLMQDYRMREIFKPTMAELGLCIFQLESFLQVHFGQRRQHFVLFSCMHIHSLRKQPLFCDATTGLCTLTVYEMTWEMSKEFPYWWCVTTQIWVVLLIGCTTLIGNLLQPISMEWWCVISREFLHTFFRGHFAGKPVVALRNVRC